MSTGLKLISDYADYYDDAFDQNGESFCRFQSSGFGMSDIYKALKKRSFRVPLYGVCKDLKEQFNADSLVMVQDSDFTTTTSSFQHILDTEPDSIIYEYIKGDVPKLTFRQVVVGNRSWMMRNVGDGFVVYDEVIPNTGLFDLPMYFIDLKKDCDIFYAIDFGFSPKLADTGMDQHVDSKTIVDLLRKHYVKKK